MLIRSFIDVMSTDPICSKEVAVATLGIDEDLYNGKRIAYNYRYNETEKVANNSIDDVQNLRDRIIEYLTSKKDIIFINHTNYEMYTNIKEDPFFLRLAKNTEYQLIEIDAYNTIQSIVEKVLPLPRGPGVKQSSQSRQSCNIV